MEKFPFWNLSADQLYKRLGTGREGLSTEEAGRRLTQYGCNSLKPPERGRGLALFISQFKSPLICLLIGAAVLSFFLGGRGDAAIILVIVVLSGLLGYF